MGRFHKIDLMYKLVILGQLFETECILQCAFTNEEKQPKLEILITNFKLCFFSVKLAVYLIYVYFKYTSRDNVLQN